MTLKSRVLSCGTALAALTQSLWGQPASPWRVFRAADGLPEPACASVTVGPQGTILARHLNKPFVTKLDGYSLTILPAPPISGSRIHESPAGQLWAAAPDGLFEFKEGDWVFHLVPEIAVESAAIAPHPSHGVPLCPVRQGRVLFLLRDRLMALNAEDPEHVGTELLRSAKQTRLGAFLGLTPARDGGLWISGARGLAKLPGPVRALKADSEWEEFELSESLPVRDLREPRTDDAGGLTTVADSVNGAEPVIVHFDGQQWTTQSAGTELVRFAWIGPEQTRWLATTNALFSRRDARDEMTREENFADRRFLDAATDPVGVFWLATSGGLYRHAPPVWRTPASAASIRAPVHGLVEDLDGRLWFVSDNALQVLSEDRIRAFPLADRARRRLQSVRTLLPLADGSLLFEAEEQLLRFQPASGRLDGITPKTSPARFRLLGLLKDRSVCVQRLSGNTPAEESRLETFDGGHFKPLPGPSPSPAFGQTWFAFSQTRNGDLWLSGERGVAWYRDAQWKMFSAADRIAPEGGIHFAEAADGRLWCATPDQVWLFDGRQWSMIRAGFESINALAHSRDGSLWVASNSGLHRFHRGDWVENSTVEGLPAAMVTSLCEDRRGQLWAGTSQGLSRQHPDADPDPPRTEILPPFEKRIPEGGAITLDFRGLDKWKFTPLNRLLYSHRLDEGEWSAFRELGSITFTDLSAGRHVFQVRAMDRNGNIEPRPAQFSFIVALPWHREARLVAIGGAGLAVALFFAALAFNRHLRLRRSYAEVERQVAERTRELELASRELVHSQKMNALGTLAAGIAHDFNNILSIVKGSAQIIEDNLDRPEKVRTRVERIKTVVDQGAGIVRAMLGFSRGSDETLEPCDLNAVVDDTITLLGDRFLREVELRFDRAPELPAVPAAKNFVQQILLNFLFNAAESMHERKRVVLSTTPLEKLPASLVLKPVEAGAYVSVAVRDFGCGIPPANLPRIFEPFFTTKALSTRRGTGLGLSMAYDLAKRMHAGLAVESEVGQGSVFTLILPVKPGRP